MPKFSFSSKYRNISEEPQVLIVDKIGVIGQALCKKFLNNYLVVFASYEKPDFTGEFPNMVYVPYVKRFPTLPEGNYSHIIAVDDFSSGTKDVLDPLMQKAKESEGTFVFISYVRQVDKSLIPIITNYYKKSLVILYGDVFDKKVIDRVMDFRSDANSLIYQAATAGKIKIKGDGLSEIYPIFMDDLIEGIAGRILNFDMSIRILNFFQKQGQTQLSFSHMIQKPNPTIGIDFVSSEKGKEKGNFDVSKMGEYAIDKNYDLQGKVKKINLLNKGNYKKQEIKHLENVKRHKFRSLAIKILFFLFVFLILPLITALSSFALGINGLKTAVSEIDRGNLALAKQEVNNSRIFLGLSENAFLLLTDELNSIGINNRLNSLSSNITFGKTIASSILNVLEASDSLLNVLNGTSRNPKTDFENARELIKSSIIALRQMEIDGDIPASIQSRIKDYDYLTQLVANTVDVWPEVFGFNGKQSYLVLFQNNAELRPGGGFIGSYAILSVDMGRVSDFSIHDVYDADGQLKGHIEPPYFLRRYLPTAHLYLRDSNYDIDFSRGASTSAFILNQETGDMVDGVIGIDLSFVKDVIGAMGNVYVSDYNQTVNKDNIFLLAEAHAEKNFFPGSSQKKDFLRSLFLSMQMALDNKKVSYSSLAKAVNDSIAQKHLLFAFDSPLIQNIFTANDWSSSIWDDRENDGTKINDYLGINEANLGVDKSNYFVKRKVEQRALINQDGFVSEQVTISYYNGSRPGEWPGGDYKNYLRVIAPQSTLKGIVIDGQEQIIVPAIVDPAIYEAKGFIPPKGLEVQTQNDGNKTVYGFLIMVPVGELKTVTLEYDLAQKVSLGQLFYYTTKVFKQPGTDGYPFEFSLAYPASYGVIGSSDGITVKNNQAIISENLLTDESYSVNFAAK